MNRREFILATVGSTAALSQLRCSPSPWQVPETAFLSGDVYLDHDAGEGHAESPNRLLAIQERMNRAVWSRDLSPVSPVAADLDTVALVHTPEYIRLVKRECESGSTRLSTGDTNLSRSSYDVALTAVGGVVSAVDQVMTGQARNAFCAVRPPGHHASAQRGMGFCIFNNVAIAARHAQKVYGVERVLIADWDVHHGNGTQDTFYEDGSVFFMSTHQSPLYPNTGMPDETGEGPGLGLTMNRPFPAGAGNAEIVGAFRDDLLPAAREFRPELTLISAGFDSRVGDRLGGFTVDDDGFRDLTRIMMEIADIRGAGKLVSVLEGGYTPAGLASAVAVHLDELRRA